MIIVLTVDRASWMMIVCFRNSEIAWALEGIHINNNIEKVSRSFSKILQEKHNITFTNLIVGELSKKEIKKIFWKNA